MIRQLGKEKEALTDITEELRDALVTKRKEGIESARQMERGRTLHSLHVLVSSAAEGGGGRGGMVQHFHFHIPSSSRLIGPSD